MKRNWTHARPKLVKEGRCRVCGASESLQAAHTIGRAKQDVKEGEGMLVLPDAIVPLCQSCHESYDGRRLDLLPYLTLWEQVSAVEAAGGIERARKRLTGGAV